MRERSLLTHALAIALLLICGILPCQCASAAEDSLLWGPYRPNVYFGMRPRIPESILTGLLWSRVENYTAIQSNFRYTCEQHQGMAGYGWDEYDPRTGGRQTIADEENMIDITTSLVKFPGGSWGVRIQGNLREDAPTNLRTMVVFSISREGLGSLELQDGYEELGFEDSVVFKGDIGKLGNFKVEITSGPDSNAHPLPAHSCDQVRPLDRTAVRSLQVPAIALWQAKGVLFSEMQKDFHAYVEQYGEDNLPPPWSIFFLETKGEETNNIHMVQKVFEGPFEFDVLFSPESRQSDLTSRDVTEAIPSISQEFADRYKQTFKATSPFDKPKYDVFSKSLFSNLIGGIGYFYGDHIVDRSNAEAYEEVNEGFWEEAEQARAKQLPDLEGPFELFTSVPSRPFFPRGFYWDEGFHLVPILDWDPELTLEIVTSWFNLVDEDGWIAREQILGAEARSKVPQEFQTQYPHYANPPTLFLIIQSLANRLGSSDSSLSEDQKALIKRHLEASYPLLKRHYMWFRKTQRGDLASYDRTAFSSKEAYRWRGRTPRHILTSGLDDYPRAQPPHPGELHVDLISWVGLMTRAMKDIATHLSETDDAGDFAKKEEAIIRNIDDLHWSDEHKAYCDSTVDSFEETVHVCHKGYVSLFPFLTGLLPADHPHLGTVLDLIGDPDQLWSNHGIRSLSKQDPLYGTDENYWRSPIWMNINYLVVTNLLRVAQSKSTHRTQATDLYTRLRQNLVDTVYKSWKDTGFAWEQYSPETGAGQRTQHFTGWTSLVVKIMCMPDLGSNTPSHQEL